MGARCSSCRTESSATPGSGWRLSRPLIQNIGLDPGGTLTGSTKRVFVSWGGDDSLEIAQWIKGHVLEEIPDLGPVYLSESVPVGSEWRRRLKEELENATHCIGIMTDVSLNRPWFVFELATLYLRLPELKLLRFCPPPDTHHPLEAFQSVDGFSFDAIKRLALELLVGVDHRAQKHCMDHLDGLRSKYDDFVRRFRPTDRAIALRHATTKVIQGIGELAPSGYLLSNSCVWQLAEKTFLDTADTFFGWARRGDLKIDRARYPDYLVHLLRKLRRPNVLAVAIVDDVEEFWDQKTGMEILEATPPGSKRIFVFKKPNILERHIEHVMRHARKYQVRVISGKDFYKAAGPYKIAGDFSVISELETNDRVTAFYDEFNRYIMFTPDTITTDVHLSAFNAVFNRATPLPQPDEHDDQGHLETLISETFHRVEDDSVYHSDVIPIELYDAFEEDHPYYREMHDEILRLFREYAEGTSRPLRVLEIGAGTGHLTKRLAQQRFSGLSIVAMEPDPAAQDYLDRKVRRFENVSTMQADFLTVDPSGEFDLIVSSFAEHHIPPERKSDYFSRVMGNLRTDGFFIVGDEFLPAHDVKNRKEYESALRAYHGHIIDVASGKQEWSVVRLEKAALDSGLALENRVDFKTTLDEYCGDATRSGLELAAAKCVSRSELAASVGGVYVLEFRIQGAK